MSRAHSLTTYSTAASVSQEAKLRSSFSVLKQVTQQLNRTLELFEEDDWTELKKLYPDRATQLAIAVDFYQEVRLFETWLIRRALKHAGGRQNRAAALLGLKTTTLNAKIKAYKIDWREVA